MTADKAKQLAALELSTHLGLQSVARGCSTADRCQGVLPAHLVVLNSNGEPVSTATVHIIFMNQRSISFEHASRLTARRVRISLDGWPAQAVDVELTWCRFNRSGHYTSGGRFAAPLAHSA